MIPIPGSSFFSSLSLALKTGRLPLKTKNLLKQKTEEAMSAFKKNLRQKKSGQALRGKIEINGGSRLSRYVLQNIVRFKRYAKISAKGSRPSFLTA